MYTISQFHATAISKFLSKLFKLKLTNGSECRSYAGERSPQLWGDDLRDVHKRWVCDHC